MTETNIIKRWLNEVKAVSKSKKQMLLEAFKNEYGFDANDDDYHILEDKYEVVHKVEIPEDISKEFSTIYFSVCTLKEAENWTCMTNSRDEIAIVKRACEYWYEVSLEKRTERKP